MRKITVLTIALAILVFGMALSASAHHRNPDLVFDPGSTIDAGTQVTVTAVSQDSSGNNKEAGLFECLVEGLGAEAAACNGDSPAGTWTLVATSTDADPLTATKTFTPVAGTYGFRATGTSDSLNHGVFEADLVVNAVTSTDRHKACNGIEVAHERVQNNNASEKAKSKIAEKAAEFSCDV